MTAKIDGFDFSEAPATQSAAAVKTLMSDADFIKERTRVFSSTPQNKALVKKPQRTKAPLSSSAPSLQHKSKASKAKKKDKPAFATHAEQMLLAAVLKYGNNYQLARLAGTTPDILSRFARKERTLRLDTAGQVAAALGIRFQ